VSSIRISTICREKENSIRGSKEIRWASDSKKKEKKPKLSICNIITYKTNSKNNNTATIGTELETLVFFLSIPLDEFCSCALGCYLKLTSCIYFHFTNFNYIGLLFLQLFFVFQRTEHNRTKALEYESIFLFVGAN
jgi:hypothetical protein